MTRKGLIILALWVVILFVAGRVFDYAHPTTNPNAPDYLSDAFNLSWIVLFFAGILWLPRHYRKKQSDDVSPATQSASERPAQIS
jgi:hypothetical protein